MYFTDSRGTLNCNCLTASRCPCQMCFYREKHLLSIAQSSLNSIIAIYMKEQLLDFLRTSNVSGYQNDFWMLYLIATAPSVNVAKRLRPNPGDQLWRRRIFANKLILCRQKYLRQNPQDPASPEYQYKYAQDFPLLRLPIEIRQRIYRWIMPLNDVPIRWWPARHLRDDVPLQTMLNMRLVNRQISEEFTNLLFGGYYFEVLCSCDGIQPFGISGPTYQPQFSQNGRLSATAGPLDVMRKIRNLELVITGKEGLKNLIPLRENVDLLCTMIREIGCVESLRIGFGDSGFSFCERKDVPPKRFTSIVAMVEGIYEAKKSLAQNPEEPFFEMTDIEYVLEPFNALKNIDFVDIELPDRLEKDERTEKFRDALEEIMESVKHQYFQLPKKCWNLLGIPKDLHAA